MNCCVPGGFFGFFRSNVKPVHPKQESKPLTEEGPPKKDYVIELGKKTRYDKEMLAGLITEKRIKPYNDSGSKFTPCQRIAYPTITLGERDCLNILVIEDSKVIRKTTLNQILASCSSLILERGRAIDITFAEKKSQIVADEIPFHLVISDHDIVGEEPGFDAVKRLRDTYGPEWSPLFIANSSHNPNGSTKSMRPYHGIFHESFDKEDFKPCLHYFLTHHVGYSHTTRSEGSLGATSYKVYDFQEVSVTKA